MKLIAAFLKLVRWPNLIFIVLTQLLFYYCIYLPLYQVEQTHLLTWLIIASVSIAAAGYIINDYFDLNIDQINKPDKNVLNSIIHRRWAIIWHLLFSTFGIGATIIAVGFAKWYLVAANIVCVALLWLYSTSFKRQLLIGNVVISLLSAWTVLILFFAKVPFSEAFNNQNDIILKFFRLAFLYGGFAFVISLVREAIKDIEDREGDAHYGCKTLPIYAGVRATKIYIATLLVVLIVALIVLQLYVLQFNWIWAVVYSIVLIISPLVHLLSQLFKAQTIRDYGKLSVLTKLIMFTGILSMIFFRLYF